jgi:hypothetical protein
MLSMSLYLLIAVAGPAASPSDTAAAAEADPIVCRGRSESVVGTRIKPKKICMKKSDWDYQERHAQRELQQINQRGNNPGPALGRDSAPQ